MPPPSNGPRKGCHQDVLTLSDDKEESMVLPLRSFRLYPHSPRVVLPLVKSHLPHSLPLYGTLKNALRTPGLGAEVTAWTSFPTAPAPGDVWTVIMQLPAQRQSRIYCSAESALLSAPTWNPKPALRTPEGRRVWRQGQDLVNSTIDSWASQQGQGGGKVGAVSLVWNPEVLGLLGSPVNPIYDIWLAPYRTWWVGIDGDVDKTGLLVDQCRIEDCEIPVGDVRRLSKLHGLLLPARAVAMLKQIQRKREVKEDVKYYTSQMDRITVVRPDLSRANRAAINDTRDSIDQGAVAWVMTHRDGNLGALYTVEGYRGRGLSRWVIAAHMARLTEDDAGMVPAHAWTSGENVASVGLWKRLGWEKGWSARWINLP